MQNVKAKIVFTLEDEVGKQMHKTSLEYDGLNEQRVLFLEKHLIGFLVGLNEEATEMNKEGSVG